MSSEHHAFSTREQIELERSFIDLDAIPAGFVVIKVREKHLLLPRQFAGLIFRHRVGLIYNKVIRPLMDFLVSRT